MGIDNFLNMKHIWNACGCIESSWSEDLVEKAVKLYTELFNKFESDDVKNIMTDMGLEEWWNTYVLASKDELKFLLGTYYDEEVINEFNFDKDSDYSIIYDVLRNLIEILEGDFTLDMFLEGLSLITLENFKCKETKKGFYNYRQIYDLAVDLITTELQIFHEINNIWQKTNK